MKMLSALLLSPGTAPYTVFVEDNKEAIEGVIGSELAVTYPWGEKGAAIVFAKEQEGKEYNRVLLSEKLLPIGLIRGTFLITGSQPDQKGPDSLSPEQVKKYMKMFCIPDKFHMEGDKLMIEKAVISEGISPEIYKEETQED